MTLQTWKDEFYPVAAVHEKTWLGAAKNSLRKWRGLTSENLKKHGVTLLYTGSICDNEEELGIDARTCALCQMSLVDHYIRCGKCKLFKMRDERCDEEVGNEIISPYGEYKKNDNPGPMINQLEQLVKLLEENEK